MSKLPVVSGRKLVGVLEQLGFTLDRQRGSHMILRQADITPSQLHDLL